MIVCFPVKSTVLHYILLIVFELPVMRQLKSLLRYSWVHPYGDPAQIFKIHLSIGCGPMGPRKGQECLKVKKNDRAAFPCQWKSANDNDRLDGKRAVTFSQ